MLFLLGVIITASLATILPDANISLFLYDKIASPNVYKSKFNNKRIWITGASSGIGQAIAELFAQNHYKVIITGRRNDRLETLKADLESQFETEIACLNFDVRDMAAAQAALNDLPEAFQNIDILR